MGKATGFLKYERKDAAAENPLERIRHFREFRKPLPLEEQKRQGARCMDCGVPFCQSGEMLGGMVSGCPLHNLIPETNDLVCTGNWRQAYERLTKTHCFPEFTGRVCPALCEAACTCGLDGKPVATKDNEKAIIEYAFSQGWVTPQPPKIRTEKKVAVVGSGPAGLAAAMLLNRRGHQVTVYEREEKAGGLLRFGIPNMKLEKEVLDRRIRLLEEEGVIFRTGTDVGKDIGAKELQEKYDRILLACGASEPRDINVPGRDSKNIFFAVEFLTAVTKSLPHPEKNEKIAALVRGKQVLVIGGGDTGNDCVGTVIRLGAKSVTQLEMMPRPLEERGSSNPWPQWPKVLKTDYGQQEAAALFGADPRVYQTTVKAFEKGKDGSVEKAVTIRLEAEKEEKTKRTILVPKEGSEKKIDAQLVLIAAGFLGSQRYVSEAFGIKLTDRGNVQTSEENFETSVPGIFAAGDMRRGQSLVVWAIREGRQVAKAVDASLMGYSNL